MHSKQRRVALRKESVDRNNLTRYDAAIKEVALRKESVDRNIGGCFGRHINQASLSARRAWIEIWMAMAAQKGYEGRSPQGERG